MNAKPHIHQAELKPGYALNFGERWYVKYGDQLQYLDLPGDPYAWDAEMLECVVGQAAREARERHDAATATSQRLQAILARESMTPRWQRLFDRVVGRL